MNILPNLGEEALLEETFYGISLALLIAVSLILVVIAVTLLVTLFTKRGHKDESQNHAVAANTENDDAAVAAAIAAAIVATEDQGAILAAITAAISVVWESEHPGTGFRVVSYRHIDKRSPWNAK